MSCDLVQEIIQIDFDVCVDVRHKRIVRPYLALVGWPTILVHKPSANAPAILDVVGSYSGTATRSVSAAERKAQRSAGIIDGPAQIWPPDSSIASIPANRPTGYKNLQRERPYRGTG